MSKFTVPAKPQKKLMVLQRTQCCIHTRVNKGFNFGGEGCKKKKPLAIRIKKKIYEIYIFNNNI